MTERNVKDSNVVSINERLAENDTIEARIDSEVMRHLRKQIEAIPDAQTHSHPVNHLPELSESDHRALVDEAYFKKRFGFALGKRGRQALLEVIDLYDLSDHEVRRLNRFDCFRWDGHTLHIHGSWLLAATGTFYIVCLGLFGLACGLALAVLPSDADASTIKLLSLFVTAIALTVYSWCGFVWPPFMVRHVKRRSA
jgi:hypothetical protein